MFSPGSYEKTGKKWFISFSHFCSSPTSTTSPPLLVRDLMSTTVGAPVGLWIVQSVGPRIKQSPIWHNYPAQQMLATNVILIGRNILCCTISKPASKTSFKCFKVGAVNRLRQCSDGKYFFLSFTYLPYLSSTKHLITCSSFIRSLKC